MVGEVIKEFACVTYTPSEKDNILAMKRCLDSAGIECDPGDYYWVKTVNLRGLSKILNCGAPVWILENLLHADRAPLGSLALFVDDVLRLLDEGTTRVYFHEEN